MWIEISPLPRDFCGSPPCPHCYRWAEDGKPPIPGINKMALDLLQMELADLPAAKVRELRVIAKNLHKSKVEAALYEPEPDPQPPAPVDIGMSLTTRITKMLSLNRPGKKVERRLPTVDEVFARQAEREAKAEAEELEETKRLMEIRKIAKVFAETQKPSEDQRRSDIGLLRMVEPGYVRYCEAHGITDPREIYDRARGENALVGRSRDPFSNRDRDRFQYF